MKTKAAVLRHMELPRPYAESRTLSIEEVDLDGPKEGEVLVQVAGAGLCHSDLSVITGSRPRPVPMVLGHVVHVPPCHLLCKDIVESLISLHFGS